MAVETSAGGCLGFFPVSETVVTVIATVSISTTTKVLNAMALALFFSIGVAVRMLFFIVGMLPS